MGAAVGWSDIGGRAWSTGVIDTQCSGVPMRCARRNLLSVVRNVRVFDGHRAHGNSMQSRETFAPRVISTVTVSLASLVLYAAAVIAPLVDESSTKGFASSFLDYLDQMPFVVTFSILL